VTPVTHALAQIRYAMRHAALRRAVVGTGVAAAGLAVVALGYWWPAMRAHAVLEQAIHDKRQAVVAAMSARDVKHAHDAALRALPAIEQKLNVNSGQSDLVERLNRLARKRGIRIISESYEEGKAKSTFVPLHLDIALQGSYAEMRGFIADIATLPVWGEIQEARLEGLRDQPGTIKAQLRLVLYRRGGPTAKIS